MEIKKTLLHAILIGVTVGTTTSCGMFDQIDESTDPIENTEENKNEESEEQCWINCPACGMG